MRKKVFLTWTVCLVGFFAAACLFGSHDTAYAAPKTYEWNLSTWGSSRAMTKAAEWWAKEMAKRTNGRFKVKWGWGNVLAKQPENLMGIKSGLFEMCVAAPGFSPAQLPLAELVELPFMGGTNILNECLVEWAMAQHPALVKRGREMGCEVLNAPWTPAV